MKLRKSVVITAALVMSFAFMCAGCKKDEYRLVNVEDLDGEVTVERDGEKDELEAFEGMKLISDDVVTVGEDSELEILVDTDKHMYAEAETVFELVATGNADAGKVKISILDGSALFEIDNKLNDDSTFSVSTPNAVFSVRGTKFVVSYDKDTNETTLEVIEGVVNADYENDVDEEDVSAGEVRFVTDTKVEVAVPGSGESGNEGGNVGEFSTSGDALIETSTDNKSLAGAYNEIIANMDDLFVTYTRLSGKEYLGRDYMLYDYNQDGITDLILYLRYYEGDEYMLDLVFISYDESVGGLKVKAINTGDEDDSCFYASYEDMLVRYSWRTSPYESYLYYVHEDGDTLSYVLYDGYDEIFTDFEERGIHPLPLYGDWELVFEDML